MRFVISLLILCIWVPATWAETPVERGQYIVEVIAVCGNCHTPQGPDGPDQSLHLAGGYPIVEPGMAAVPPNITPDEETGIGSWTDAQITTAIREGVRPDGRVLGPPMAFSSYANLTSGDLDAIVAYLRTLPPK